MAQDSNVAGGWLQTFSKKKIYPLNPDPAQVCIEDIAHALSAQARFSGHTVWPYSVAQHSIYVAEQLPPHLKLAGLLHDASEAYLVDLPKPLKVLPEFAPYRAAEDRLMSVIAGKYGFKWPLDPLVEEVDYRMLVTEANQLMSLLHPDWTMKAEVEPYSFTIVQWMPQFTKATFLYQFEIISKHIFQVKN